MTTVSHWKKSVSDEMTQGRTRLGIILGLAIGILFLGALFVKPKENTQAATQPVPIAPPPQPKPVEEPLPAFDGAKTIFAVVDFPSQKLLDDLQVAYLAGTKVQLMTSANVTGSYTISIVPEGRIRRNAILIDGTSWYSLP